MTGSAQERYLEIKVRTATPGQLVSMLYAGASRFAKLARESLDAGDLEKTNHYILKTEAIIEELNYSLDMEKGGEIAKNLRSLYDFIMERLLTANVKKSKEILAEVIELLEDLQQTWNQMLEQANPSRPYIQTAKATDSSLNIAVE